MSKIIIRKRVGLGFLGDEYKEAYLTFRSIPLTDYEDITKKLPTANPRLVQLQQIADTGDMGDADKAELNKLLVTHASDNIKSFAVIRDFLKTYYLGGKFPNENGDLEDVDDVDELDALDKDTAIKCFEILTGQANDPKAE